MSKSEVEPKFIDEVIMGQVLTGDTGQNPARQAAIRAGIPKEKTGYVINQVCGSGLRSIVAGYQSILLGDAKIVIAGGQESMTNSKEEMMLKDGLIDAYNNYHMGITAENVAEKWNISRKDQDTFAASSQSKAQEAIKNNKFKQEIIDKSLDDEHPRSGVTIENLSNGVQVTTSSPNDGNNYTSAYTSNLYFSNIFINPPTSGPLHFFADIESELGDQFNDTDMVQIWCNTSTSINGNTKEAKLLKIVNILGEDSPERKNTLLFYIYNDGTVKKKIVVD